MTFIIFFGIILIESKERDKERLKKNKKYFENIQKIIGEPFLQTIIKNYLDELEILFNGKKEFLDKELAELEKRKIYLESLKNAKD